MGNTLDDILNFMIPIGVWAFLIYVIYRIPIVTEGVDKFRTWWANRGTDEEEEVFSVKTIEYE